jgi:hypothetical protein
MAKMISLNNGRIKPIRNRFGGDTSRFAQKDHHMGKAGRRFRRARIEELSTAAALSEVDDIELMVSAAAAVRTDLVRMPHTMVTGNDPELTIEDGRITFALDGDDFYYGHRRAPVGTLHLGEGGRIMAFCMS